MPATPAAPAAPSADDRVFADRTEAGRLLGERMRQETAEAHGEPDLVLGLPRGGVPVASEVAAALSAPLDVLVVRKLGAPGNPEYAIGAIGPSGTTVLRTDGGGGGVRGDELRRIRDRELAELERRERRYRAGRAPLELDGLRVALVDDGIATGATMLVAVQAARALGATEVVVGVPVAAPDARDAVAGEADRVIALETPAEFWAVGRWFRDFRQTGDAEVLRLLRDAAPGGPPRSRR